ncbi:hypothetical protein GX48_04353 [Paracoccidioides brasiliensis]|nr:hypothetical protein GX48_04353 [Paracoccidioides brasiliensis]
MSWHTDRQHFENRRQTCLERKLDAFSACRLVDSSNHHRSSGIYNKKRFLPVAIILQVAIMVGWLIEAQAHPSGLYPGQESQAREEKKKEKGKNEGKERKEKKGPVPPGASNVGSQAIFDH